MPKTRTIKMPASALEDADVQYISLVGRPANRIPYRIMKSEDITNESPAPETENTLMFKLETFLKRKTDTDPALIGPAVAAVVIRKDDAESLIPQLQELGLAVDNRVEQADVVVLKQADYEEDAVMPFKVNDDVLILVSGVNKQFEPFIDSTNFNDNAQVSGFLPGLHMATEALFDTYRSILMDSRTQSEAVTSMKSAIDQYSSFVTNLADNLPAMAFKLEDIKAIAKTEVDDVANAPVVELEGGEAEQAAADTEAAATEVVKDDDTGEATAAATEEVSTETTETTDTAVAKEAAAGDHEEGLGDEAAATETATTETAATEAVVEKGDTTELAAMLATFKSEIMEGITGVQTELSAMKDTASSLKDRLDEVETVAKSADEAARGTVQSGSEPIDQSLGTRSRVAKTDKDDELWGGVLDGIAPGS